MNLAAIGAQCARIWREIDASFSTQCRDAMERASKAAFYNKEIYAYNNFDGGGPYSDSQFSDEYFWERSEIDLYASSSFEGLASYELDEKISPLAFNSTKGLGILSLSAATTDIAGIIKLTPHNTNSPAIKAFIKQKLKVQMMANDYLAETAQEKLQIPFYKEKYSWGGNSELANRAIILGTAYQLTGEKKYRDGVVHLMDYLLGRNPMGVSYITGYGDKPFKNPHHRFWAKSIDPTRPDPPAGVLSGGPNNDNMADPIAQTMVGTCAAQTCWVDDHGAWSLNEVTINWNAPLFWMAAFLDATEYNE